MFKWDGQTELQIIFSSLALTDIALSFGTDSKNWDKGFRLYSSTGNSEDPHNITGNKIKHLISLYICYKYIYIL